MDTNHDVTRRKATCASHVVLLMWISRFWGCVLLLAKAMENFNRRIIRLLSAKKFTGASHRACIATIFIALAFIGWTYFISSTTTGVAKPYIKNQWYNFYLLSGAFDSYSVPLILFDVEVLPEVIKPRREIWHDPAYTCNVLCKHHPDGNNLITFAVLAQKFIPEQKNIVTRLQKVGFVTHLAEVNDPRLYDSNNIAKVPSYLWIARNDHVIHIVILHDRQDDYFWVGPVTDLDWITTITALKPQLTINWRTLNGAVFPRYAQAYDKSYHLTGLSTKIDSHQFVVPYRVKTFLKEHEKSRFIECNRNAAKIFNLKFPSKLTNEEVTFQDGAKSLLRIARKVLNKLEVPFWISSGTLLGWHRQCDIIPHSKDVDIGIRIHDYRHDIIDEMEKQSLRLKSILGKIEDGYFISFVDSNGIRLDIYFFYDEDDYSWNGGTRVRDGAKFQFIFPKFTLCWTEFLAMKLRIPCETTSYIEANYGKDWKTPVKQWVWYSSPQNVLQNGYWNKQEWDDVIQVFGPLRMKKRNDL